MRSTLEQWLLKQKKEFCLNRICIQMDEINLSAFLSMPGEMSKCARRAAAGPLSPREAKMKYETLNKPWAVNLVKSHTGMSPGGTLPSSCSWCCVCVCVRLHAHVCIHSPSKRQLMINYRGPQPGSGRRKRINKMQFCCCSIGLEAGRAVCHLAARCLEAHPSAPVTSA